MSEAKSYFVFRFKKEEGLPWVVYRKGTFWHWPRKLANGKPDTPAIGWSRDHKGVVASERALYHDKGGIITVDVIVDGDDLDMAVAEELWKEALGNMFDKRNASANAALKLLDRTLAAWESTNEYTRP